MLWYGFTGLWENLSITNESKSIGKALLIVTEN